MYNDDYEFVNSDYNIIRNSKNTTNYISYNNNMTIKKDGLINLDRIDRRHIKQSQNIDKGRLIDVRFVDRKQVNDGKNNLNPPINVSAYNDRFSNDVNNWGNIDVEDINLSSNVSSTPQTFIKCPLCNLPGMVDNNNFYKNSVCKNGHKWHYENNETVLGHL